MTFRDDYTRPIGPADELHHTPEGGLWRENWWTVFVSKDSNIRGNLYCGVQPGIEKAFIMVLLYRGDEIIEVIDDHDISMADCDRERGVVGPLTYTCIDPMSTWRVSFEKGSTRLDLEWESIGDPYDWSWGSRTHSRHYEQPGRISGTLKVGGERILLEGFSQRDRAWGTRERKDITWAWSGRAWFDDLNFQHAGLIVAAQKTYCLGYAVREGTASLIDAIDLSVGYDQVGGPPVSAKLKAALSDGTALEQDVSLLNVLEHHHAEVSGGESHQFFTFSEYTEGQRSAAGHLDHWWADRDLLERGDLTGRGNDGEWIK